MSKNIANLRFQVWDEKYGHSGVWRFWITKHGDIYLSTKGMAGKIKVSFHKSGICRYALTAEHASELQIEDRLLHRWLRPKIPVPDTNLFARLCALAFSTNYLSYPTSGAAVGTKQVPAAVPPGTTFIEIGLTRDSENTVLAKGGNEIKWGMLLWTSLSPDVNLFVRWYHNEESMGDITMPASHGLPGYRFVHPEHEHPDRPIRFQMQTNPKDHDALFIFELGGCRIN
jgi:hypothetical protein